eukprot:COSAG06_NODE_62472_length_265_cov_0.608434_1_plen_46_part_01
MESQAQRSYGCRWAPRQTQSGAAKLLGFSIVVLCLSFSVVLYARAL